MTYLAPKEREKPKVYWVYGARGTGKTKWAHDNFKDIYWKDKSKWWDGYDNQETLLLLDDFRPSQMKFSELLTVLDRYPKHIEVKRGYRWLGGKNILITSNKHPNDCYMLPGEDTKLTRRIDHTIEFKSNGMEIIKDPYESLRSRGNTIADSNIRPNADT